MWALVLGGLRAFVVQAEHCGNPTPERMRSAAEGAIGWLTRNQHDDGSWLYRYDRDTDAPVEGYNLARHAGVSMSLEQAANAGFEQAALVGERGIEWAVDHLYDGPGWRAFAKPGPRIATGPSGLITAAMVYRRDRTGDTTYDGVMHELAAFMVAMVNERGQVYGYWDTRHEEPVPESWSKYFTGEVFFALALMERTFPGEGYGDVASRIADYIAFERDDAEHLHQGLPDHWAGYGLAAMTTWPGYMIPHEYETYLRQQAGLQGLQIRYESQRTNSLFSYLTRGRQTLGSGLGTIGEELAQLSTVARTMPELDDIVRPLAERARCTAGALIDRQVGPDDVDADDDPDRVLGAWFQFDVTQMDDEQHSLSALLGAMALEGQQR